METSWPRRPVIYEMQPLDHVPAADLMLIHKLMIEADEETYLQKANRMIIRQGPVADPQIEGGP